VVQQGQFRLRHKSLSSFGKLDFLRISLEEFDLAWSDLAAKYAASQQLARS
jgi:hypothetical protein